MTPERLKEIGKRLAAYRRAANGPIFGKTVDELIERDRAFSEFNKHAPEDIHALYIEVCHLKGIPVK